MCLCRSKKWLNPSFWVCQPCCHIAEFSASVVEDKKRCYLSGHSHLAERKFFLRSFSQLLFSFISYIQIGSHVVKECQYPFIKSSFLAKSLVLNYWSLHSKSPGWKQFHLIHKRCMDEVWGIRHFWKEKWMLI